MDLQKFGIKLFFQPNGSYPSRDFIPELHRWIQNDFIPQHMLIDVVDYSHILDGPGIMLIAHEAHFSMDQENHESGILYMRKIELNGNFTERLEKVFQTSIQMAKMLSQYSKNEELKWILNAFRFIANDRRLAHNNQKNRKLYSKLVKIFLNEKYPTSNWEITGYTGGNERLAFTINFTDDTNIFKQY